MKKHLLYLFLVVASTSHAQDLVTDHKGDFLFGVPTLAVQTEVTSKTAGVSIPIFPRYSYYYVQPKEDTSKKFYTMRKILVPSLKINVVNNSKSILIFDGKTNYSPSAELGLSWGFDSLFAPSRFRGLYSTFAIAITGEYQNFKYYDKVTQSFIPGRTNRVSPGIKLNASFFKGTAWAASFSLSGNYSIVTDELTSFQNLTNTFYTDQNIATNGTNDGYIAPGDPTKNIRFSVSVPQFWISGRKNSRFPFVVVPYYSLIHRIDASTTHNAGIVASFIPKRFRGFDRDDNGNFIETFYQFSKSLGIGYNALSNSKKDPHFIFISGTFAIGQSKGKKSGKASLPGVKSLNN